MAGEQSPAFRFLPSCAQPCKILGCPLPEEVMLKKIWALLSNLIDRINAVGYTSVPYWRPWTDY